MFQKWLKTGSEVDHDLYKKSRNMITDSIRRAKYACYQNTISKTGAQGIFKLFRQIQHKKTSSLKTSIVSDTFNEYFASIATVSSDKLSDSRKKFPPPLEIQSFYLTPVFCSYINESITHMKPKNLDTIPIKLIKLAGPIVTSFLTKLRNDCITNGIFPFSRKITCGISRKITCKMKPEILGVVLKEVNRLK